MSIASELHPLERKLLPHIKTEQTVNELEKKSGLKEIEIIRAAQWLSNKKLAQISKEETEEIVLGKNGKQAVKHGLPEKRLYDELKAWKKNDGYMPSSNSSLDKQELNISIGLLKKHGIIAISKGKELELKAIQDFPDSLDHEQFLKGLPAPKEYLDEDVLKELQMRKNLIESRTTKIIRVIATDKGKKLKLSKKESIEKLTPEMLKKGVWENKEFRKYDVSINVPKISGGTKHPLQAVIELIRQVFIEMGFQEMKGPNVETAFWCMDSMWIPQDHPAREVQDTFYLPYKGKLPERSLVNAVKKVQETGGKTGSKGYGVEWDEEKAKELLLRTHTTATTFRTLHQKQLKKADNAKYFYIGRIYRNEAIDATHLPEFHQAEGFVMQENLTLKHLMGFIKDFYAKMGIHKIKFKVTYNPYTEPSLEALYYHEKSKKWIELINSGIFRPESLEPYGINKPVIAWGLGVERLAMILYDSNKLKDLLGATCDIEWLKNYKIPVRRD